MGLNVRLEFRDSKIPELTEGVSIIRLEMWQEISEVFSVTITLRSLAPQIDMSAVVGQIAQVHFTRDEGDGQPEPVLPMVEGMVRRGRQLAAMPEGGMSTYELVVVHQLWLFTRRRGCGIAQRLSAPDIFKGKLQRRNGESAVKIPDATGPAEQTRVREYTVQYNENDYHFARRILAEDGIAFYFEGNGLTTPTLVSDTSATRSSVQATLPFKPPAGALIGTSDAVIAIDVGQSVETDGKYIRDYNFDHPLFRIQGNVGNDPWFDYAYEEGALHAFSGDKDQLLPKAEADAVAKRRLEDLMKTRWTAECRLTCPLPVGAVLTVTGDHPIADTPLTVVRAITILEYPDETRGGTATQIHRVSCVQASFPYRPRQIPKERIHGIQRAIVCGSEHIDVDEHGRVLLSFFWDPGGDNIDPRATDKVLTRRVPVSQGWAGPNHGFVVLPRTGDEVLVAYIDGDPDEPVVVGRIYNGVNRGAVKLPDDKTQSLWRTESSPSLDGFHEIRFEDRSGEEELHIEAQRLHTRLVKGSEVVNVNGSRDITVGGTETEVIHQDHSRTVDANEVIHVKSDRKLIVDGAQRDSITGDRLSSVGGTIARICANHLVQCASGGQANVFCTQRLEQTDTEHSMEAVIIKMDAKALLHATAGVMIFEAGAISLVAGSSRIDLLPGIISINAPMVKIN